MFFILLLLQVYFDGMEMELPHHVLVIRVVVFICTFFFTYFTTLTTATTTILLSGSATMLVKFYIIHMSCSWLQVGFFCCGSRSINKQFAKLFYVWSAFCLGFFFIVYVCCVYVLSLFSLYFVLFSLC